jgi:hypothetical protein
MDGDNSGRGCVCEVEGGAGGGGDLGVGEGLGGGAALAEAGAPRVGQARLRRRAPLRVHLPRPRRARERGGGGLGPLHRLCWREESAGRSVWACVPRACVRACLCGFAGRGTGGYRGEGRHRCASACGARGRAGALVSLRVWACVCDAQGVWRDTGTMCAGERDEFEGVGEGVGGRGCRGARTVISVKGGRGGYGGADRHHAADEVLGLGRDVAPDVRAEEVLPARDLLEQVRHPRRVLVEGVLPCPRAAHNAVRPIPIRPDF